MSVSALSECDVIIARIAAPVGSHIRYYPSEEDAVMDRPVVLEFWDKPSFKEAFQHARKFKHTGLLKRFLAKEDSA